MLVAILLAVIAALAIAILGWVFKRPREYIWGKVRRLYWRMFLRRREQTEQALARIAAELLMNRGTANFDNEYYLELLSWFTGDPDANPDYAAMNERVQARIKRGEKAYGEQDQIPRPYG